METINANSAFLCNYEVMQILQELKDNTQKKHKREGSLATVTYETVHYLQETECKYQTPELIQKFLEAMKEFKLTKTEKLMMVNTPPRTELEIQLYNVKVDTIPSNGQPPARAVLMLSNIIGLDVECKEVNVVKLEHRRPEFIKLNPMGTVPVIQDGDFVLSESHAIMKYLLQKFGSEHCERLYPSELRTRALVDQCSYFDAGVFFTAFRNAAFSIFFGGETEASDQDKAQIDASYQVIEAYLRTRPYIATDRLTLADLSAGSTATAMQCLHKLDDKKFPRSADWMSRLNEETFFKTINKEGTDYFAKLVKGFSDRNRQKKAQ